MVTVPSTGAMLLSPFPTDQHSALLNKASSSTFLRGASALSRTRRRTRAVAHSRPGAMRRMNESTFEVISGWLTGAFFASAFSMAAKAPRVLLPGHGPVIAGEADVAPGGDQAQAFATAGQGGCGKQHGSDQRRNLGGQ